LQELLHVLSLLLLLLQELLDGRRLKVLGSGRARRLQELLHVLSLLLLLLQELLDGRRLKVLRGARLLLLLQKLLHLLQLLLHELQRLCTLSGAGGGCRPLLLH
jgi:hypothetical protein